jgi:hypothetical protein
VYLFVEVILGSQGHIEGGLGGFFHDGTFTDLNWSSAAIHRPLEYLS